MATHGHETTLKRGDGVEATEAFTAVANIAQIVPPNLTRDSVESTVHNTADRHRTFIPGLRDGGEVSLVIDYDEAAGNHTELLSDFNDDLLHNYQVEFPTAIGMTWSFSGFITALGDESPIDDRIQRSITFKVSGKPTLATTA